MAFVTSGDTITDIAVYLTPKGKELFLTGKNFKIKQFGLGDSDTNYLTDERIGIGEVPDISGDGIGCIKSVSGGILIKSHIWKDGIPKPEAYIIQLNKDNINVLGDIDFNFKLGLTIPSTKRIEYNFDIKVLSNTPITNNLLTGVEYKGVLYSLSDFNNLSFIFNMGDFETDVISLVFSSDLGLTEISSEILVIINILQTPLLTLNTPLVVRRFNQVASKPIINQVITNEIDKGIFTFEVILEDLSYNTPLIYQLEEYGVLEKDIVFENTHILTNRDDIGYPAGVYTLIVQDSIGQEDRYIIYTPKNITTTLSILDASKFLLTTYGGSNTFSFNLYKKETLTNTLLFSDNVVNSNTITINNGSPIATGTYFAVVRDSGIEVTSNEVTNTLTVNLPIIERAGFTSAYVKVETSNVSQTGNHRLETLISYDGVNFSLHNTVNATFVGRYSFFAFTKPTNFYGVIYYKVKLYTSYGLDSNTLEYNFASDELDLPPPPTSGGCFSYENLVLLENNTEIQIKDVKVGDRLKSYSIKGLSNSDDFSIYGKWNSNILDMEQSLSVVKTKTKKTINYYYLINNKLKSSYDHPFLVEKNGVFMFLQAKDIKKGDYLINKNGNKTLVSEVLRINRKLDVISIDVDNSNLYIVNSIIVHNKRDVNINNSIIII